MAGNWHQDYPSDYGTIYNDSVSWYYDDNIDDVYGQSVASYDGAVTAGDRLEAFSRTLRGHHNLEYVTPAQVSAKMFSIVHFR